MANFTIRMITIDCTDPRRLADFYSAALDAPVAFGNDYFIMIASTPNLGLQRVEEPTPGKNRIHIDGGGGDRREQIDRLVGLGAKELETHSLPEGYTWTVLSDPEGNQFCVGDAVEH